MNAAYLNRRKGGFSLLKTIRTFFVAFGLISFAAVVIAITGYYEPVSRWLSTAEYAPDCDYILLLPAGPVPNPATLTRAYKAAQEHYKNPASKIVISHILDTTLERSTIWGIRKELILRGVPEETILLETRARNTGEHAQFIKEAGIGDPEKDKYLIVTSSLHIKRSVMAFNAAGFKRVYATPVYFWDTPEDLGLGQFFRYEIWDSLLEEILILRELTALAYYKLSGKI